MTFRIPMQVSLALFVCLFGFAAPALSQPNAGPARAEVKRTVVSTSAVRPGDKAMLAVELDIKEGFHAQSRTPSQDFFIKFNLVLDKHEALTFGEPTYPAGHDEEYPGLGKLNVYTGNVVVLIPVEVKPDAAAGDLKVTGKLTYQLCDDKVCYPPEKPKFEIKTSVVPAGTEVKPNEPELFKEAEKNAAPSTETAKPQAAVPVNASNASAAPASFTIFGLELGHNAYLLAFAGAFVVGVIFNVMPCVLPVVPLKIMGFYEVAQHSRARSLAFGAVFSAGLVASFGVLAVLIVVLRVIDWGELFTKWWFVVPMVIILVAMAISMFGVFTVNVPTSLYNITPRHDTYVGNFMFGILTAALSTPCTFGMFVGLLAWALTQPAIVGVALIMMVGVGMAFPYFVLSAFPEAARKFPRGGAWGEVVKQFMGFLLLATAVYFAAPLILKVAGGMETVWWLIFATMAAGALFLLVRGFSVSKTNVGRIAAAVVAIVIMVPSVYGVRILTAKPFEWQPFTPAALEEARAQGKTVLVEFTATWCGNCHYLEATVLKSDAIVKAVRKQDVVMLKADVTDDGAPGRPLLSKLSPAGAIPLTAVYPAAAEAPIQLTGIYQVGELLRVLDDAASKELVSAAK